MARSVTKRASTEEPQGAENDGGLNHSTAINQDEVAEDPGATEGTPLLATDLPADVLPSNAVKYKVILMCAVFLFIIDVGSFVMDAPTQQLMEDVICRDIYPDHQIGKGGIGDKRCKIPEVQTSLASLKSMTMFTQMLCPLLVQVPFGLVADKYGRRPVLFLAMLGVTLVTTWSLLVLLLADVLPLWSMVPGALLLFIGGGGPMSGAMIYTIIADVTPVAERAPVFYQMAALMLILSAILGPLSAWLMSIDPWLPAGLGEAIMILGTMFALFVPETKTYRAEADAKAAATDLPEEERPLIQNAFDDSTESSVPDYSFLVHAWKTMQSDSLRMWRFVLSSPRIMMLIICEGLAMPIGIAMLMYALQYISARFDWEWSKATYVISISRITACIMLLVVLPLVSRILTKNFQVNPMKRDLGLARFSAFFIMIGSLLLATAGVPWMLMLSLAVFGLSSGYGAQCRALITGLVEPHMLATVNTTMSMTETILSLLGTPLIGWLLGRGLEMGGAWQGLPYFVFTLIGLFMVTTLSFFRIPATFQHVEEHA